METYIQKLRGVIDIPENASGDVVGGSGAGHHRRKVFARRLCRDAFSAGSTEYTQTVRDVVERRGGGRPANPRPQGATRSGIVLPDATPTGRTGGQPGRKKWNAPERTPNRSGGRQEGWFQGTDGLWRALRSTREQPWEHE